MILKSVISSDGMNIGDMVQKKTSDNIMVADPSDDHTGFVRRTVQHILHDYPTQDIFFKKELKSRSVNELPLDSYGTVFSPDILPSSSETSEAKSLLRQSKVASLQNPNLFEFLHRSVLCMFVSPEYFEDLSKFKKECHDALAALGIQNDVARFIHSELTEYTDTLRSFYWNLSSIQAVAWLNSRRPSMKKMLLEKGFPFVYSKAKAVKARMLLQQLSQNKEYTRRFLLSTATELMVKYQMLDESIAIHQAFLDERDSELDLAAIYENIAVCYREKHEFLLMLENMSKAYNHCLSSTDSYRICLCCKNLAEAEWYLGMKESAKKRLEQAEILSEKLEQNWSYRIYTNLANVARRIDDRGLEIRYLAKCLVLCPDDRTDEIIQINARLELT
jgi:hypothetical protein